MTNHRFIDLFAVQSRSRGYAAKSEIHAIAEEQSLLLRERKTLFPELVLARGWIWGPLRFDSSSSTAWTFRIGAALWSRADAMFLDALSDVMTNPQISVSVFDIDDLSLGRMCDFLPGVSTIPITTPVVAVYERHQLKMTRLGKRCSEVIELVSAIPTK